MLIRLRKFSESVISIEIWLAALAIGVSMVSSSFLLPTTLFIFCLWIIRRVAQGRWTKRTPADWAILGILLTMPITLWATISLETTSLQVFRLLTGVGIYYAIVNWVEDQKHLYLLGLGIAIAGILLSILGILGVEWTLGKVPFIPTSIYQILPRWIPDPIHRNVMAGTLVIIIPYFVAAILYDWRSLNRVQKSLYCLSLSSMLIVLFLTQSRGGIIALASALLFMVLLRWKRGWLLLASVAIIILLSEPLLKFSETLKNFMTADMLGGFEGRIEIWSRALSIIGDFPFTGVGLGNFGIVADTLYPFIYHSAGSIPHAHNLYLQIATDIGLPGLISWLAILFTIIIRSWNLYHIGRQKHCMQLIGLGAGFLCCQIALTTHGLIDAVTWGMVRPSPIVWAMWGFTVATSNTYIKPSHLFTQDNL